MTMMNQAMATQTPTWRRRSLHPLLIFVLSLGIGFGALAAKPTPARASEGYGVLGYFFSYPPKSYGIGHAHHSKNYYPYKKHRYYAPPYYGHHYRHHQYYRTYRPHYGYYKPHFGYRYGSKRHSYGHGHGYAQKGGHQGDYGGHRSRHHK